jgi:hypothetical protein
MWYFGPFTLLSRVWTRRRADLVARFPRLFRPANPWTRLSHQGRRVARQFPKLTQRARQMWLQLGAPPTTSQSERDQDT